MATRDQTTKIQSFSVNNAFLMLKNIFLEQKSVIVSHKYLDGIMFCSHSYRVHTFSQKQQNFQFSVQTLLFQNSLVHWLGGLLDVKTEKPNG